MRNGGVNGAKHICCPPSRALQAPPCASETATKGRSFPCLAAVYPGKTDASFGITLPRGSLPHDAELVLLLVGQELPHAGLVAVDGEELPQEVDASACHKSGKYRS
jgi:hypothetical protein